MGVRGRESGANDRGHRHSWRRSLQGCEKVSTEPSEVLRQAAVDVRYLLDRGYPRESAVRFVSDHYRLPQEQRFVLMRVVVPTE
ncbi:MAG: DUF434 domain-containing protein, partial [Methanotrichaceae archaeon]|nr:DUF434 domain-containing protein [Methanotrichaceae archaeon]